jgi:hypothetical protein
MERLRDKEIRDKERYTNKSRFIPYLFISDSAGVHYTMFVSKKSKKKQNTFRKIISRPDLLLFSEI